MSLFPNQAEQKMIYEKLEGKTWTCSECTNKINRDTMNPFLRSMCESCQNSMTGNMFNEPEISKYDLTDSERKSLNQIKSYFEDAIQYCDSILTDKTPFEYGTEFDYIIRDFTSLSRIDGQNTEFIRHVQKIKDKIDKLDDEDRE